MLSEYIENLIENALKFIPTDDQKRLLKHLSEFLASPDSEFFLLKGYAGTGKTSIVAALVGCLSTIRMSTVLMAPTGRAAKVLASYADAPAYTIHKTIYRVNAAGESSSLSPTKNMHRDTVFIIDEASMISTSGSSEHTTFSSRNLLDDMMNYVKRGTRCKTIIVGDDAQLPPVGYSGSPALDINNLRYYGNCMEAELREVVRQSGESGILYNATAMRKQIEQNDIRLPFFDTSFPDIVSVPASELMEAISDAYSKYGQEQTVVICRSNKRVNIYNEGIRNRILCMEGKIDVGDRIMIVKNNYQPTKNETMNFIANGEMATIRRIKKYTERYGLQFVDMLLEFADYDYLELYSKAILDTLYTETPSMPYSFTNNLYLRIAEDYEHIVDKRARNAAIKKDSFFNALQIKFAYAVTCHKAQGGQWECVFLDTPYFPGDNISREDLRWFYTALTRASKKLCLINFDEKYFKEPTSFKR